MAQAVCEKPQTVVEDEICQKLEDLKVTATVNHRAPAKSSDDLVVSANGAAKANGGNLSSEKSIDDLASVKANGASDNGEKKNRIQVSNTKKPLFFYLNLAKRYIKQYNDVELSALGMAIPTVVTIAEILKANGVAVEKKVLTSTVGSKDETKGRLVQKAKIEIVLEKSHAGKDSEESVSKDGSDAKEE